MEIGNQLIQNIKQYQLVSQGHYMKGIYFENIGSATSALKEFDMAIISDYQFIDAYIEKAIILYDNNKFIQSLDLLNKAIKDFISQKH